MKRIKLEGQRFARLVVLRYVGGKRYSVRCDCGSRRLVFGKHLRRGHTKSCGCLQREAAATFHLHHGNSDRRDGGKASSEYEIWKGMKSRCANRRAHAWKYYGGRGVRVCAAWRADFSAFLRDMGRRPSPSHSIDRINNDGNYEPGNCRWATVEEQARNRRVRVDFPQRGPNGAFIAKARTR